MPIQFGACRFDVEARQLVREGREVHLSPKAFELLQLLLTEQPRVLTKRRLMDLLWPDTYVAEVNLSVLVAELRHAVGDRARQSAVIRTHHSIGYSFIAETMDVPVLAPAPSSVLLDLPHQTVSLRPGVSTVGRDEGCDVLINDPTVSRRHASLSVEGALLTVEDLGSKNGTCVDGQRITAPVTVTGAVSVLFGAVVARLHVAGARDTTTLMMRPDSARLDRNNPK